MDAAQNPNDEEFGFQECTAGFSTDIAITKDTIPVYEELEKTAMIPDKHCNNLSEKRYGSQEINAVHHVTRSNFCRGRR